MTGDHEWFRGDFATWEEARRTSTGYDAPEILEKVLRATKRVIAGEAAFERDSVVFERPEVSPPLLACLLYAASRGRDRLEVIDIGGSLGSTYWQYRKWLEHLERVRWSVVEQPPVALVGAAEVANEVLEFFDSIAACAAVRKPGLALLSSVLPYVERPYELLSEALSLGCDLVIIDRTPFFVEDLPDRITVETVHPDVYEGSYPAWFFGRSRFDHFLVSSPYKVLAEFDSWERWQIGGRAAQNKCLLLGRRR